MHIQSRSVFPTYPLQYVKVSSARDHEIEKHVQRMRTLNDRYRQQIIPALRGPMLLSVASCLLSHYVQVKTRASARRSRLRELDLMSGPFSRIFATDFFAYVKSELIAQYSSVNLAFAYSKIECIRSNIFISYYRPLHNDGHGPVFRGATRDFE